MPDVSRSLQSWVSTIQSVVLTAHVLIFFYEVPGTLVWNSNCSHCCTRRNLCFNVENSQHADQKQLTCQWAFDLDIESTHRPPASCRARPVSVDDGPEDIRWTRVLGGEKLPAASYCFFLKLKGLFFCHRRGIENFCRLFSTQQRPNTPKYVCIKPLAGARHVPPAVVWTLLWPPFRSHGAVVGVVDRCLSRTRNLAASN